MTDPPVTRRLLTSADDGFLRKLFVADRAAEFAGLEPSQIPPLLDMQFGAQRRQYAMEFPDGVFEVLSLDGATIGHLGVCERVDLHLIEIMLAPEFRRKGIGTELLRELQERGQTMQKPLTLRVMAQNPARRLYGGSGFVIPVKTGRIAGWSGCLKALQANNATTLEPIR